MATISGVDTLNLFPASPTNHILRFHRLPHLSYVLQECGLPGVSTNPPQINLPGHAVKFTPDRLTYDPLVVTFLVDEEFRAWQELQSWLVGTTGGDERQEIT